MGILNKITGKKDENLTRAPKASEPNKKEEKKDVKADAKKEAPKKAATEKAQAGFGLQNVVLHPLVTEKTAILASQNQYVFVVALNANRVAVRSAIRQMYGVTPESVNIIKMSGKRVRFGRRRGKRKDWKKAIVTLPKGKTIDVYEGV